MWNDDLAHMWRGMMALGPLMFARSGPQAGHSNATCQARAKKVVWGEDKLNVICDDVTIVLYCGL